MRSMVVLVVATASLAAASPAGAGVSLGASCTDGVVTCGVNIFNADYDWQGVIVQWCYGQICDAPYHPVEMDTLALPAPWTEVSYTVTFPAPDPDEWLVYRAFAIAADGTLQPAPGAGDPLPYDWAACENAVVSRGFISGQIGWAFIELDVCPDTCWFPGFSPTGFAIDVSGVDPASYEDLLNTEIAVDIWGTPHVDGMPGGTTIFVTAITPVPDGGCGPPVAATPVNWSTVKSLYRE